MSDPIPHNRNRLGYWISLVTHPLVLFIPALLVVLKGADVGEAFAWVAFIALVIFFEAFVLLRRARQHRRHTYQRQTRHPIYGIFWLSMLLCLGLAAALGAPYRLVFSLLALCIWVPFQYVINARFTKISVHAAVVTGVATALIVMGELNTPFLVTGAGIVVLATVWARIVTGNHSPLQVGLGMAVSVFSVLVAAGLMSICLPL